MTYRLYMCDQLGSLRRTQENKILIDGGQMKGPNSGLDSANWINYERPKKCVDILYKS